MTVAEEAVTTAEEVVTVAERGATVAGVGAVAARPSWKVVAKERPRLAYSSK